MDTDFEPALISPVITTPDAFSSAFITPSSAMVPNEDKTSTFLTTATLLFPALSVEVAVILMAPSFSCSCAVESL